jgi:AcrR family transcriptional regulator
MAGDRPMLRADAARNRVRIVEAARAVFAADGLGVGIDVVARRAGVGVGTIYRRFPTKEDLLQAIVDDSADRLVARLGELGGASDPWEAFAAGAEHLAGEMARDRGFFEALQETPDHRAISASSRNRALAAVEPVLRRAQAGAVVRDDIEPIDVLYLCANAGRVPSWRAALEPDLWRRYLALALDGLRPEGAHALPHPPAQACLGGGGGDVGAGRERDAAVGPDELGEPSVDRVA